MAYYLCKRGFHKWRACVGGLIAWMVCLYSWCASMGYMPAWVMYQRELRGSVGDIGRVPVWVKWALY